MADKPNMHLILKAIKDITLNYNGTNNKSTYILF